VPSDDAGPELHRARATAATRPRCTRSRSLQRSHALLAHRVASPPASERRGRGAPARRRHPRVSRATTTRPPIRARAPCQPGTLPTPPARRCDVRAAAPRLRGADHDPDRRRALVDRAGVNRADTERERDAVLARVHRGRVAFTAARPHRACAPGALEGALRHHQAPARRRSGVRARFYCASLPYPRAGAAQQLLRRRRAQPSVAGALDHPARARPVSAVVTDGAGATSASARGGAEGRAAGARPPGRRSPALCVAPIARRSGDLRRAGAARRAAGRPRVRQGDVARADAWRSPSSAPRPSRRGVSRSRFRRRRAPALLRVNGSDRTARRRPTGRIMSPPPSSSVVVAAR